MLRDTVLVTGALFDPKVFLNALANHVVSVGSINSVPISKSIHFSPFFFSYSVIRFWCLFASNLGFLFFCFLGVESGCKFSADEERTVIELQSEFGNKWARIATYLPGRTDNDVKNFWSSRQKRLARILHNSSDASSSSFNPKFSSSHRCKGKNVKPILQSFNPSQVILKIRFWVSRKDFNFQFLWFQGFGLVEEEITASSSTSKTVAYSSDQVDDEDLRLPDLGIKLEHQPFTFGTDLVLAEFSDSQNDANPQAIPFSPESRELLARLDDPFYYDILGPADSSEPLFALPQPFFEPSPAPRRCRHVSKDEEPDVFLDDFPADMFDQVDPIRTP